MGMTDPTNPRKLYVTGGNLVVSIPRGFAGDVGVSEGDRVVLEATEDGFEAVRVEFRRASNV